MSGIPPFKPYVPDRNLMFCEGQVQTVTGNAQFASADQILKIGRGRMDPTLIINISAIKISATNELYDFWLQGSDDPTFATGIANLAHFQIGAAAVLSASATLSGAQLSLAGVDRFEIDCNNVQGKTVMYDYVRLRVVIAGTAPTITYDAWLAQDAD